MNVAPIESLPDRRRRLVRADLALVALELFGARGFDAVTVDEIAAAAGISQRTFFRYFATKEDVVLDFEEKVHGRLLLALDQRLPDEGPVEALRNAYVATSHVLQEERTRVVLLGRILAEAPTLRARVHGRRGADNGALVLRVAARMGVDPDADARPRTVVAAMTAVVSEEWQAWVRGGGHGDPAVAIAGALALLEHGLSALDHLRT